MPHRACYFSVFLLLLSFSVFGQQRSVMDSLQDVSTALQKVNTAHYYTQLESYAPGDTLPSLSAHFYAKEFRNATDTFVGAQFVMLQPQDTTSMSYGYDGWVNAHVDAAEEVIIIDSFQYNRLPFRPIRAPFFTRVGRLLQYVRESPDSLHIQQQSRGDALVYQFTIYDQVVEIIGNRVIYPPPLYGTHEGEVSYYELWVDPRTQLPIRLKRVMPHNTSIETCSQLSWSTKRKKLVISDYFPPLPLMTKGNRERPSSNLLAQAAPDWQLIDVEGTSWSLADLSSKLVLLQFTSVSCGPCLLSVPFLKQLATEHEDSDLQVLAIESFNSNAQVLDRYRQRHGFSYPFLLADKEVSARYQIAAVPVFYLLDEERVIRKFIRGYRQEATDQEIREAIADLLKQ